MNEASKKPFEPIKDEEREWLDNYGLQKAFSFMPSTIKKYKGAHLLTESNFAGKVFYDGTFIKRVLIHNMKRSTLELKLIEAWEIKTGK